MREGIARGPIRGKVKAGKIVNFRKQESDKLGNRFSLHFRYYFLLLLASIIK